MQTAVCVFSQRLRPRFIPSSRLQVRVRVIRCLFLRRFQLSRGHLMLMANDLPKQAQAKHERSLNGKK